MDDVTPIRIPQDNVNDDRVLILEWLVADGTAVAADQVLVEVETSKSVFEITAPHAGVLRILTPSNREIPVGDVLCLVGPSLEAIDRSRQAGTPAKEAVPQTAAVVTAGSRALGPSAISPPASPTPAEAIASRPAAQSTRFSRRALEILQQRGLSPADFAGRGLLRARDLEPASTPAPVDAICRTAGRDEPPPAVIAPERTEPAAHASKSAAGVPYQSEPLSRIKRVESRLLAWSTREAIRSSVSVLVPTAGRTRLEGADPDAAENRTAFLIQACAMLLRRYPLLNACCLGEEVRRYEQVHIGYAIDGGKGLKVPVLREADTRTLAAIAAERRRFVTEYLAETLRPAEFAGGTFTITDLSAAGVLTCDPLLSEGQSGILGIGAEHGPSDASLNQHLVLAFDHRLVEGRMASTFLNDLKGELVEYERTLLRGSEGAAGRSAAEPSCSRCGMTVSRASERNHFLVSVAGARLGSEVLVCTVCLRGR